MKKTTNKKIENMELEQDYKTRLAKAQKRVKSVKKFYKHLRVFIIVNIILLILKFRAFDYFNWDAIVDQGFVNWFQWNLIGTPSVWGLVLIFHAIYVFVLKAKPFNELGPNFTKEWEERKMEEFMNEDRS